MEAWVESLAIADLFIDVCPACANVDFGNMPANLKRGVAVLTQ